MFAKLLTRFQTRWELAALGVWTVRDLVGHASRAITNVERYCAQIGKRVEILRPVDYFFRYMEPLADSPEAVAERGRQSGQDLGSRPAEMMRQVTERVVEGLEHAPDDLVLALPVGGMRLIDYLPTRIFELTTSVTLHLLADLALESGNARLFTLAATGRRSLPNGFNLVG